MGSIQSYPQGALRISGQTETDLQCFLELQTGLFSLALFFGRLLHKRPVGRIVRKVEDLLVKCGKFRLPSQRQLYQPGWEWKVMVVDVGEMEIERPQKNRDVRGLSSNRAESYAKAEKL